MIYPVFLLLLCAVIGIVLASEDTSFKNWHFWVIAIFAVHFWVIVICTVGVYVCGALIK